MLRFRSLVAYLLITAMLCTYFPGHAHALTNEKFVQDTPVRTFKSGRIVNPLYADVIDISCEPVLNRTAVATSISTDEIRYTLSEASDELRQGMIQRKAEISVTYPANAGFDADMIWQTALAHTGDPKAGDYLMWQWSALEWNQYYDSTSGVYYYTTVFYPEYFTTAAQETEMDAAVDALLNELDLWSASGYSKVKGVYDWMCANITYDQKNLKDEAYLLKHSAYAALIHKTAVCQGYALLFYRLCLELGVDVRYIYGKGNGGDHGWNIVKLGGLYYNVDATWDASLYQSGAGYSWFLKGNEQFLDHISHEDFCTPEFKQTYPIDPSDFGAQTAWPITGACGQALTWQLSAEGVLTISGSGDMYNYYSDYPGWYDYAWHINSVVIDKDVSSVGAYAFYYCSALESVTVTGKTDLKESAFIYCNALRNVQLGNTRSIGSFCFLGCTSLSSISIPASVTSVGVQVFNGCTALKTISVAEGNGHYSATGNILFSRDMTRLVAAGTGISGSYAIPATVKQIDEYAFSNCASLEQISIPASVSVLAEGVFSGCKKLKSVQLQAGLLQIGDLVFNGCGSLSEISLPDTLQSIGYRAFEACTSLTQFTVPASVTFIGELALADSGLKTLRFQGEAPDIADDALSGVFCDAYVPDPACYTSWTYDKLSDYGGFIVWYSYPAHKLQAVVTEPTCSSQGYTTYTCAHCGYSYVGDHVPTLEHNWDGGVTTVEPTVDAPGQRLYTCKTCGATKTELIEYPEHTHTFTVVVTQPTCTEGGYTTHTCAECDYSFQDSFVDPLGHRYGDWYVSKAPTCTENGEKRRECDACDHFQNEVITATGHSFGDWHVSKAPTCTENGEKRRDCDACDYYEVTVIAATGHSYGEWYETQKPTCTQNGMKQRDCKSCGHSESASVAAVGHSYTSSVTAPTCSEQGYTTFTCHCGYSYQDSFVDPLGHRYGEWYETQQPTCTQNGTKQRDCKSCGHSESASVAAEGHSYTSSVTAPTCTEQGYTTFTCHCGYSYQGDFVNATGHSFTKYVSDGNATCTQDGTKTAKCDHGCGATDKVTDSGSKIAHDFEDWTTVKRPTTKEEGLERRNCKKCEHFEERAIPMLTGPECITSDIYKIGEKTITQIPAGMTIADFLEGIHEAEYVWFYKDGKEVDADSFVSTGMELQLKVGDEVISKLTLIVTGDTNGDGKISVTDMLSIKSHILKMSTLKDGFFLAGDVNGDGNITITDFIQIKAHILGKSSVVPI